MMGIGELARRTGKSVHAIRWYESRGLIPGVVRDQAGRRHYHPDHVGWLEFIERLQATGMTIARIAEYAVLVSGGHKTLPERVELLKEQELEIARKQEELDTARALIHAKIGYYRKWAKTKKRPTEIPSIESVRAEKRKMGASKDVLLRVNQARNAF